MTKSIYFLLLSIAPFIGFSQTDVGIVNLKVVKPYEILDGGSLQTVDTIEQVQFEIKNFTSSSITMADLPNGQNTLHVSYNGQTKIVNVPLLGSIASQGVRQENIPENFSTLKLLPAFPFAAGNIEVCVKTVNAGDPDATNNEVCITINNGGSVGLKEQLKGGQVYFRVAGKTLINKAQVPV